MKLRFQNAKVKLLSKISHASAKSNHANQIKMLLKEVRNYIERTDAVIEMIKTRSLNLTSLAMLCE